MADSSPLAGLSDRAARILNLVGELADAIRVNEQSPNNETQRRVASAWKAMLPAIVEVGESLPSDPSPIADWIREVGRVSKWFDGELRKHGLADVLFRFNCDGFIRVADEGETLFREMAANRDPFAFVDSPAAVNPSGIDTTPAIPIRSGRAPTAIAGRLEAFRNSLVAKWIVHRAPISHVRTYESDGQQYVDVPIGLTVGISGDELMQCVLNK